MGTPSDRSTWRFDTRAARAGEEATRAPSLSHDHAPAIHQTAVWEFDSLQDSEAVWSGAAPGYIYRRYGGPNQAALEAALAALEEAPAALALASGQGATMTLLLALLKPGDRILATEQIYGGTQRLLTERAAPLGIEPRFGNVFDLEAVAKACDDRVLALWVETVTNPTIRVADLPALARLAHERKALLIVDNTFATPALCRPLTQGADVVFHSATKYIGGHDDAMAGIIAGSTEHIGACRSAAVDLGPTLAPFEAWLLLRGLRTLALRMQRACANALNLATRLAQHPQVEATLYPGLPTDPDHARAQRILQGGFGAMVSFVVRGGAAGAAQVVSGLEMIRFLPSLGGLATSVMYPAGTSHRHFSAAERERLGVRDGLLRLSVGIEDPDDLWADLERALRGVR